ncbi:MAG: hypothetical protein MUC34_14005 [Anaerolineae bacterium]|nr:hypothetical protein [Anaerolineae bacterium]
MRQPDRAPRKARVDPPLLLALLLPVFAVAPLAYPGYFELRTGFLPVFALTDRLARLSDFAWTPEVGAAHSIFGGNGVLPYWLAAAPSALGAAPYAAIKWVMAGALLAASVGAFCWLRGRPSTPAPGGAPAQDAGGWPGLAGAAVYVLNPLTLGLVYREGAFAAVVLLGLLPWTLWAADRARGGRWRDAVFLALLVGTAVRTQATLGLAQAAILLAYILISGGPGRTNARALVGVGAGVALGALLWLPALVAKGMGAAQAPALLEWLALGLPWLALLAGWAAARLEGMLAPEEAGLRPALFGGLLALVLLVAYAESRPVELPAPIPSAPLAIFGENELALIDVKTEGTPGPDGRIAVEAVWQALRPLERDYTVFFHVVGPDGQRYGQQDGLLLDGETATSGWTPGRLVTDRREAVLATGAPSAGAYQYWLGVYDGATGTRLTTGADDKFVFSPLE